MFSEDEVTRFWERVERGDGCWMWAAGKFQRGYGAFAYQGKKPGYAHRFSYELHHGPIPAGAVVMHTCDNRACVNPAHLRLGTQGENVRDAVAKDRWMTPKRYRGLKRTRAKNRELHWVTKPEVRPISQREIKEGRKIRDPQRKPTALGKANAEYDWGKPEGKEEW